MAKPISRVYSAFQEGPETPQSAAVQAMIQVNGTQPLYDWNEVVNFFPGDPEVQATVPYWEYIPDGQLASAGNSKYAGLDLVRDDWPSTQVQSGPYELVWFATTPHDPSVFRAFITTDDWDTSQPLNWAQMEELDLGPVTLDGQDYKFNTILPARSGKHVIYVIWQRLDPVGEGFYAACDVDFGAGPAPDCPADLNEDSLVDGVDLGIMLSSWNQPGADLDGDGNTDGSDIALLLAGWGPCGNDCNGNGQSDSIDIEQGAADCNFNGIPDECEGLSDCDGDGISDACAILDGLAEDCNMDLVPDGCQLQDPANDVNEDGILDDCQIDGLSWSFQVENQWEGGFIGSITIYNDSGSHLHCWNASFDAPFTLVNAWDAILVDQSEGRVFVMHETYNKMVDDNDSVTFGFEASGQPGQPSNVYVNNSPADPE